MENGCDVKMNILYDEYTNILRIFFFFFLFFSFLSSFFIICLFAVLKTMFSLKICTCSLFSKYSKHSFEPFICFDLLPFAQVEIAEIRGLYKLFNIF